MPPADPARSAALAQALRLSPLAGQCLINRGLETPQSAETFLAPRLRSLADPGELPEMEQAVERLWRARENREAVTIFGDYDVDGITATAILLEVLRPLGFRVQHYLPQRLEEGYGLSAESVERCLQRHATDLMLCVDCGSTSVDMVARLASAGIDTVILDHHQASSPFPAATALVNPQLRRNGDTCDGAGRELCSAGLAFKLCHALLRQARRAGVSDSFQIDLKSVLDLVALGTVADLVPLLAENRILVHRGLEALGATRRLGLRKLKELAQVGESVGVWEVGFQLAPRLNAAGRLETADAALQLLLTADERQAETLAVQLDRQNRERQQIERSIFQAAFETLKAQFDPARDLVLVAGRDDWHIGVVGVVASRILKEFYRPTLILGGDAPVWRGSGRSIEGFDLAAALSRCSDLLERHGGHAMAAGVSIRPENLDGLRRRLNEYAREALDPARLQPSLRLDAAATFQQLGVALVEQLLRLGPFGQGNAPVQFCSHRVRMQRPPLRMGKEQQHLRLSVTDGTGTAEAVWWNAASQPMPTEPFDLAYAVEINEFKQRRSVQLRVLDWRPTAGA